MVLISSFGVALRSLATNKLRSSLTMLGIIIGTSAVIVLVSIGQGVQTMVSEQMQDMGSNVMFVMSGELGQANTSMRTNFLRSANLSTLTIGDAAAIVSSGRAPLVQAVAPEFVGSATASYGNASTSTTISGVTSQYPAVRSFYPILGRFVDVDDVRANARVAVLGQTVVEKLFPAGMSPLGETIKINRAPFQVIGVMQAKGGTAFGDEDDAVFVPLTTAQTRLFGGRQPDGEYSVSVIYAQATDEDVMEAASEQIRLVLRQRHGLIYSTDEDDFSVLTQADITAVLGNLTAVLTMFLGLIAAISLLVGGIGIMNIMLVSVTERTREIGIRKAVGAKQKHILFQFLVEAIVLSLLGGAIGIAIGVSGTVAAANMMEDLRSNIDLFTILLATGFSVLVGLFFGIYPAFRAARLDPIEALRYE